MNFLPSRKTLIRQIDPAILSRRGWRLEIDGQLVAPPSIVALLSDTFGELHYGLTQAGYDSWSYVEPHGGVVIIPYHIDEGLVYVGVVDEFRHNLGGWTQNCPRGFVDEGEAPEVAALRELAEEAGIVVQSCVELPGGRANPNSAFFETPDELQGIVFFAVEITREATLDQVNLRGADDEEKASERIGKLHFIKWQDAVRLRDMFTIAAVARLLAYLKK